MQRTLMLASAAIMALSLAACNKNANNTSATGNEAVASGNAENASANSMNPGQSGPVNKAQDTVGAAVGATSAATLGSHDTGAFVDNLVQGNTYEIEAAKIAEQKAQSPDVKAFAKMMVRDHTALGNEAKPVIAKSGKTPPTSLDQRRQGFLDNLKAAGPQDFDKTYMDQQVAAHKETLSLLNGYAQNGDNADLKGLATKAAPTVQKHLDKAQSIDGKLAGGGGASGNTAG
jgi:putative membrane protein